MARAISVRPAPTSPRDAEHFAPADGEGQRAEPPAPRVGEAAHGQPHGPAGGWHCVRAAPFFLQRAPDHGVNDLRGGPPSQRPALHMLPVAEHRVRIAGRKAIRAGAENFFHPVAHIQDGDLLLSQLPEDSGEAQRFPARECAGRLIKKQHARVARHRRGDLRRLRLPRAQPAHRFIGRDVIQPQPRQPPHGFRAHCGAPHHAETGWQFPQQNILRDGEIRAVAEFLRHQRDPRRAGFRRRSGPVGLAIQENGARIRPVFARQHFHQRGFTRAVLPQQRMPLPAAAR